MATDSRREVDDDLTRDDEDLDDADLDDDALDADLDDDALDADLDDDDLDDDDLDDDDLDDDDLDDDELEALEDEIEAAERAEGDAGGSSGDAGPSVTEVLHDAFNTLPALPDSVVRADPLTVYMARLRQLPVLGAEQQQQLAVLYKEEGDLEAAKMLVLSNLRLVIKIAREYQRRWTNLLDLIQEGNVGLSEAIRRYDPYRKVKFTSYAQYWIRAMILNYLMNHFQPVRIGSTRAGRKLFYNLKKARAKLTREGFLNPSPALIAQELGVDEKDVVDVSFHLDVPPLSLEANAPGYENTTVGDLLADRTADSPEQSVADEEFQVKVRQAMDDFAATVDDERDRALWFDRMTAEEPLTLAELGERFGVSKERIRQLEVRLKDRFRRFISERLGATLELIFNAESA